MCHKTGKMERMIGRTLAHYEIVEELGSGGMGDVYRARDKKLERDIAIKVLPAEFSSDPERRKRFMREAKAIAALKHPNIVHIYSIEEVDEVTFISMELVEGGTLGKAIPDDGLSLDRFFEYAIPLADAISSAHDSGITHRDLKPANVMIDREGRLKVLDFGLAKLLESGLGTESARTVVDGSDTAVGALLGTAAYMSPEQAEGKPIDHRSDIFSLGIILYQMATGERPFKGETQLSTLSSILKDTPRHISEIRREVPRHVGRIVSHCLEKKPDARYQSAKDVRNELIGVQREIDSGELTAESESGVSKATPAPARRWLPLATVAVVVVAAVAFFVLRSGKGGDRSAGVVAVEPPLPPPAVGAREDTGLKMAVVLPFENLGPPEDAYFAAGMTEEITTRLSSVASIGVISGTSARQYDRTGKTMRQIGEDLGVDYVLEGSVRWAKSADGSGEVRISPRLIQVAGDKQIWSQTYDQALDNIFDVQSDIATRMIEQLDVTLTGREQRLVQGRPTENIQAYTLFLKAEDLGREVYIADIEKEYVDLMTQATDLDPNFLEAWAKLAGFHMIYYGDHLDESDARIAMARRALRKAEALDPDHPLTHYARGNYFYYGFDDYEQALKEFVAATEGAPSDAYSRLQVGNIHRRLGHWDQMIENQVAALHLDPQNVDIAYQIATSYGGLRDFANERRYGEIVRDLRPDQILGYGRISGAIWRGDGDVEGSAAVLREGMSRYTPRDRAMAGWYIGAGKRDYRAAIEAVRGLDDDPVPFWRTLMAHWRAIAEAAVNDRETARPAVLEANKAIETLLDAEPDNNTARRWLAVNLALLGRADAAIREARLAIEQTAKDQFFGPRAEETLAEVYARLGRPNEALDLIEELLHTVYVNAITVHSLELEGRWDNLRGNPRFEALLARGS